MTDISPSLRTLGVEDLAPILHRSVATIKSDIYRRPDTLPPRISIPGSTKLLWLETDVIRWIGRCSKSTTHRTR